MREFEIISHKEKVEILIKENFNASLIKSIKPKVYEAIKDKDHVIFNFNEIEIIDSIGLGFLITTYNTLKKRNGSIELINLSHEMLDLFKIINLHKYFSLKGV